MSTRRQMLPHTKVVRQRLWLDNDVELVTLTRTISKLASGRGNTKQGRIGPDLDSLPVGHELQDTKPSVSSVSFPAAAKYLDVEHHLGNRLSCTVVILPI